MPLASLTSSPCAYGDTRARPKSSERELELLRDQNERPSLLREERRMLLDLLEREPRERLEARKKVSQLRRELDFIHSGRIA